MTEPTISIGLPVFNGEEHLAEAIGSLLGQTFGDFDLLISDNASTDGTGQIAREAAARDRRVRYERLESNVGAAENFNRVFRRTRGRYFKWAAHDDIWLPEFLSRAVAALEAEPGVVLAYPRTRFILRDGRAKKDYPFNGRHTASSPSVARRLYDVACVQHHSLQVFGLIRREALGRTGLVSPFMSGDRVLLAELALQGRFCEIDEVLFLNRLHPGISRKLMGDPRAYDAWYDPAAAAAGARVTWRLYGEYFRAVRCAALGRVERTACRAVLVLWPWFNLRWVRMAREALAARASGVG